MDRTTLLRLAEVRRRTTLGKTRIYELMGEGLFPRPARLGPRRVAWVEAEIDAWLAKRVTERGQTGCPAAAPLQGGRVDS